MKIVKKITSGDHEIWEATSRPYRSHVEDLQKLKEVVRQIMFSSASCFVKVLNYQC